MAKQRVCLLGPLPNPSVGPVGVGSSFLKKLPIDSTSLSRGFPAAPAASPCPVLQTSCLSVDTLSLTKARIIPCSGLAVYGASRQWRNILYILTRPWFTPGRGQDEAAAAARRDRLATRRLPLAVREWSLGSTAESIPG